MTSFQKISCFNIVLKISSHFRFIKNLAKSNFNMILRETTVIQIYFVELDTELLFVTNLINKLYFYPLVLLRLVLDQ